MDAWRPKHVEDYDTIKCLWKWKCIKLVPLLWYMIIHGQQSIKSNLRVFIYFLKCILILFFPFIAMARMSKLYRVIKKPLCFNKWGSMLFMLVYIRVFNIFIYCLWTVLYWIQSSRTRFGVSINVWRLAGDTLNITCNILYCNHKVHRDFLITLY
jgi:hypothetical protein